MRATIRELGYIFSNKGWQRSVLIVGAGTLSIIKRPRATMVLATHIPEIEQMLPFNGPENLTCVADNTIWGLVQAYFQIRVNLITTHTKLNYCLLFSQFHFFFFYRRLPPLN